MKILNIGFPALLSWSASSTHFYVCKIKGFCDKQATAITSEANPEIVIACDSLSKPLVVDQKPTTGCIAQYKWVEQARELAKKNIHESLKFP